MNFESPYVDMPHRLTVRRNLRVFALLYGAAGMEGKIALWEPRQCNGGFRDILSGA